MNQLREIIEDHQRTEKKLEDTIHNTNQFANSLSKFYKYSNRDALSLLVEVNLADGAKGQALGCCERSYQVS